MFRRHAITFPLLSLIILLAFTSVVSGCGSSPTPTVKAIAIAATPEVNIVKNPDSTDVLVGGEVAIAVEVTGSDLSFKWSAEKGTLSRSDGPSVIYTAPQIGGQDNVDVIVTSNGVPTTRSIQFTVIVPASTITPSPGSSSGSTTSPKLTPISGTIEAEKCDEEEGCSLEGFWKPWCADGFSGGCLYNNEGAPGASKLFLTFEGTGVVIIYRQDLWYGSLHVEIDGKAHTIYQAGPIKNQVEACFEVDGEDPHTLVLTGSKDTGVITLDAIKTFQGTSPCK